MRLQLLPSTLSETGNASVQQHLSCFVIDDCLAIDAGSLAIATTSIQKKQIRDVVLTHAHLDHIAGLPLFIDDLFASLEEPIRVHATKEVIENLQRHIFNWEIYPNFSELHNENGAVLKYYQFEIGTEKFIKHLCLKALEVNHKVQTVGFLIADEKSKIAFTSDTAEMDGFWKAINAEKSLAAILIECAFPDELKKLASQSYHLTPTTLKTELENLKSTTCPIYVINIKPMYREKIVKQIEELEIENLRILEVGKIYEW
ncbi:MAG: 3',5'-cyclic-nucleotide phosphodiesterase [Acidobacteria bacterium]|nr:3',5'-cyclic-nucleotide phosphodiesterase [Acidobacteriota bacterium]